MENFPNPDSWYFGTLRDRNVLIMNPKRVWICTLDGHNVAIPVSVMDDVPEEFRKALQEASTKAHSSLFHEWGAPFMASQTTDGFQTVPEGLVYALRVSGRENDYFKFYMAGDKIPVVERQQRTLLKEGESVSEISTSYRGTWDDIRVSTRWTYTNKGGRIVSSFEEV